MEAWGALARPPHTSPAPGHTSWPPARPRRARRGRCEPTCGGHSEWRTPGALPSTRLPREPLTEVPSGLGTASPERGPDSRREGPEWEQEGCLPPPQRHEGKSPGPLIFSHAENPAVLASPGPGCPAAAHGGAPLGQGSARPQPRCTGSSRLPLAGSHALGGRGARSLSSSDPSRSPRAAGQRLEGTLVQKVTSRTASSGRPTRSLGSEKRRDAAAGARGVSFSVKVTKHAG